MSQLEIARHPQIGDRATSDGETEWQIAMITPIGTLVLRHDRYKSSKCVHPDIWRVAYRKHHRPKRA